VVTLADITLPASFAIPKWFTAFEKIKDKLIEKLTDLKSGGIAVFDAVYFGRKSTPTNFPCVFIWPETIRPVPATIAMSKYFMPFTIRAVSKLPSLMGGFEDAVRRLGLVEHMLISDRSFEYLADNLEIGSITPDVPLPRVRERHEAELVVTFLRKV